MHRFILTILFSLFFTHQINGQIELKINWLEFMNRHNLVWNTFPSRWENSLFIGNGIVGSMIYATKDSSRIRWYLGRSDVGRLDYPGGGRIPVRMQIGSLDLQTAGKILLNESTAELDIWNAEASGLIKTTRGEINWRSYTSLSDPVIIIELFNLKGGEKDCRWIGDFNQQGEKVVINGINTYQVGDQQHHERSEVASGGHTIAWTEEADSGVRRLFISISSSPATRTIWDHSPESTHSSLEHALLGLNRERQRKPDCIRKELRKWWHDFYRRSFISFPRLDLESYYWIQLYKMASSSRKGYPMIDNHGVWSVEPTYGFATWDLNVQAIYRLHLKSNHLDLGEPLIQMMDGSFNKQTMWNKEHGELRAGLRQQTFLRYRFFDTEYWEHDEETPADGPAKFLWGCHNYWLQYRYSMDTSLLRRLLPKLEGGINAMAAVLEEGDDGKLHIPSGRNWENWIGKDPTGLLAVLNWALLTASHIGDKLDYDEEKIARWDSLKANLVSYPTGTYPDGNTGLLLGREFHSIRQGSFHFSEIPLPHRHWTHLLMIFPLHTMTWEEEDKRELIRNSIDYWSWISAGLNNNPPRAGYAPCASICLYASIQDPREIPALIDTFLYEKSVRGPNVWASTMYREHGPVIETPLFFAASLQEIFLQSYNGIIKVFHAVPGDWNDLVFHYYRAEGGFLVSAKYSDKKTEFIRIESLAGEKCKLQTGMESITCAHPANQEKIQRLGDQLYEIDLAKGESILIYDGRSDPDFTISPVAVQSGRKNAYGLNRTFFEKREFMHGLQEGR